MLVHPNQSYTRQFLNKNSTPLKEKLLYLLTSILSRTINGNKKVDPNRIQKILLVKWDDIGDMVYALHVFDHLEKKFPNAQIDLIAKPVCHPFFKHLPQINLIDNKFKGLSKNYQIVVDLRGSYKSLWFAFRSQCQFYYDRGSIRLKNKFSGGQQREIYTNFQVIKPLLGKVEMQKPSIALSDEENQFVEQWLNHHSIEKFAVLHIGANDVARRWPKDRFAAVANYLIEEHGLPIIFGGGPSEKQDIKETQKLIDKKTYSVAGEFDLLQFAALCAKAQIFVGNESGPLHIATVMKCPIVALFGPGVKDVFYPYGDKVKILHHFKEKNHKQQNQGNSTINKIEVEDVKNAIESLAI